MAIPERLKLPPVDQQLIDKMSELCDEIERELESGGTAEELLSKWHSHAHCHSEPADFQTYWRAISRETFVLNALSPQPIYDSNLDYSEAFAVLEAVSNVTISESECQFYLDWLKAQFPGSNISDLIYWPDVWFGNESLFRDEGGAFKPEAELTSDQILGYAMAKSGRTLPGAPEDIDLPFPMPFETKDKE